MKAKQEALITAKHETCPLPTYPLKTAFLLETQKYPDDAEWSDFKLAERTFSILDTMQKGTSDGSLTGAILIKEPVFLEPDRCFVEARNLIQFLHLVNWRLKWVVYMNWFMICFSVSPHVIMLCIMYTMISRSYSILNENSELLGLFYLVWVIGTFVLDVFYVLGFMWSELLSEGTSMKYAYQLYRSFNFMITVLLFVQVVFVINLSYYNFHIIGAILDRNVCLTSDIRKLQKKMSFFLLDLAVFVILIFALHFWCCLCFSKFRLKQWFLETVLPYFIYGIGPSEEMNDFKSALYASIFSIALCVYVSYGMTIVCHMYLVYPSNFGLVQVCNNTK